MAFVAAIPVAAQITSDQLKERKKNDALRADVGVTADGRKFAVSRAPPSKTQTSMVKYIAIAVAVIAVLLVMFLIFQKPLEAKTYSSWGFSQPSRVDRPVVPRAVSERRFGVVPPQEIQ